MKCLQSVNNQYNSRNRPDFITLRVDTISYLGPKIWDIVPVEFRRKNSLNSFKEPIKMWVPTNSPCRLCKVYLNGIGFINRI